MSRERSFPKLERKRSKVVMVKITEHYNRAGKTAQKSGLTDERCKKNDER